MARTDGVKSERVDELAIEFDRFGLRSNFEGVGENARSASSLKFDDRLGGWSRIVSGPDRSHLRGLSRSNNERAR